MEKKQPFEVNNKGSKTMFKNVVLEKLTRTHFLVPIVLYSVVSLYCMWVANNGSIDLVWWMQLLLYVAGILIFTLVEYDLI